MYTAVGGGRRACFKLECDVPVRGARDTYSDAKSFLSEDPVSVAFISPPTSLVVFVSLKRSWRVLVL